MNINLILGILALLVLAWWIYKCIVIVRENRHMNVLQFGRFNRVISGSRTRIATKTGDLEDGDNPHTFALILYPIQKVAEYEFSWVQAMDTHKVDRNDTENILWGEVDKNPTVTYQRNEWTNHHRDEFEYQFFLKDLETGEKNGSAEDADKVENIKVDLLLSGTIRMMNPFKAQFKDGGKATWYARVNAALHGVITDVMLCTIYADLGKLSGEKLANVDVKDITKGASEKAQVKLIDRINYEISDESMRDLGVIFTQLTLVEFKAADDYKEYVDALRLRATSKVNLDTADNNAQALGKELDVKKTFIADIVKGNVEAQKEIRQTEDVTVVRKAQAMTNLRVLVESQGSSVGSMGTLEPAKIVESAIGLDLAKEINDAGSDDSKQKPQVKKRGGN